MTQQRDAREAKLEGLLAKLRAGKHVQNRDLAIWLTAEEYAEYNEDVDAQRDSRTKLKQKPDEIKEYERLVKVATFVYNKGEGASQRGRNLAARKSYNLADTLFEDVLTHLQGIIAADPRLALWFDRDTGWSTSSQNSASPSGVPRVVTSRSLDNMGGGLREAVERRKTVKISAVKHALMKLQYSLACSGTETETVTEECDDRLKAELKRRLKALMA